MRPPILNETLMLTVAAKAYPAVCIDVFDGGYGWYFDATLPKRIRHRFSPGERCAVPALGAGCLADFVSYPTNELWKVRFLVSK
jgi:hypothetical protein